MSEDHPLSLVEQVTPIIDLMARTSSHFARLRDFVTLKFPPGFPVKIGNEGFARYFPKSLNIQCPFSSRLIISYFLFCRNPPLSRPECQDHIR